MGRVKRNPNLSKPMSETIQKITSTEEVRRHIVEAWWKQGHVTSFVSRYDASQTWDVIKLHPDLLFNLNWENFNFERGTIKGPHGIVNVIAPGHNPHALCLIDVEPLDGWRLLTTEEVMTEALKSSPYRVEAWQATTRTWDKSRTYCGDDLTYTYRTKAPLNWAKLKAKRKITPKDWENHPVIWVRFIGEQLSFAVIKIGLTMFSITLNNNHENSFDFGSEHLSRLEWSPDRKNWHSFTVDA